jgi:hypothetical protein
MALRRAWAADGPWEKETAGPSTTLRYGRDENSIAGAKAIAGVTRSTSCGHNRIVIPTVAYPDFRRKRIRGGIRLLDRMGTLSDSVFRIVLGAARSPIGPQQMSA